MARSKYFNIQAPLLRKIFSGKLFNIRYLKIKVSSFVYKFFQNLIYWPLRWIFSFFLHFQVETQEKLRKLKGPLVIAANHSSLMDPFLISAAFPFWSKILPIRFACWHKYFYSPLFTFFVRLLGAFPIRKRTKKIGLKEILEVPVNILKNKGIVGIFPEGRRTRKKGRRRRGRRGAAYLAIKTRAKILPIRIEGSKDVKLLKFFLRHYKVKIKIGKVFSLPSQKITKPEDLNQPTAIIMKKIREL